MIIKVNNKQTLYDLSLQYFGSTDYAFAIALLNQISITEQLFADDVLLLPEVEKNNTVLQYFKARTIVPASGQQISVNETLLSETGTVEPMFRNYVEGSPVIKVRNKQTLYDLSLEYFGSTDYAFEIAFKNNISITQQLFADDVLLLPEIEKNNTVLQYFKARTIVPASGQQISVNETLLSETGTVEPLFRNYVDGSQVIKVRNKQTLYDLSLEYFGSTDYAFEIAFKNNISITQQLFADDVLLMPEIEKNNTVLQYFKARNIIPATGQTIRKVKYLFDYELPGEFPYSF